MLMRELPFSELPGMNALFLDFLEHPERVQGFYPSRSEIRSPQLAHRQQLVAILKKQNENFGNRSASALLEKFQKPDTYCAITGQQVGLLAGPMYTLWKALTAFAVSEEAEQKGLSCVPVFWMASEDHNWHEIMNFALLKEDMELLQFSLKEHLFLSRQPTGSVPVNHGEVRGILLRALAQIKIPEIKEIYSKGTLAGAFARTLLWLLPDFPMLIVDPSDPELKQLAAPFFEKFIERREPLLQLLAEQNEELKSRHYPTQVQMEENFLPLFYVQGNERIHVRRNSESSFPEIATLSPSALLRPLFQDFLFPTLAYIGGPAEIAYFAQLHPWYEAMEIKQPWVLPRASVTLIPPATRNFLSTRNLKPQELYIKEDTLLDALLQNSALNFVRTKMKDLKATVQQDLNEVRQHAEKVEPTLGKTVQTAGRKIQYQLEKVERKTFYAVKRNDRLLFDQIRKAKNVIYPAEKLQERYLNIFSFSSRLPHLLHEVYSNLQIGSVSHQYVDI
jgi:bacillithiol synthase